MTELDWMVVVVGIELELDDRLVETGEVVAGDTKEVDEPVDSSADPSADPSAD